MELPRGAEFLVPDLSKYKQPEQKPLLAVTVKPGDHVMVLLGPNADQQELAGVQQYLKQWSPGTEFLVLSGPESITVIPATPSEDKAPQGQMPPVDSRTNIQRVMDAQALEGARRRAEYIHGELPLGLCPDKDDHPMHIVEDSSLGSYFCDADQSKRQPYAAEKLRKDSNGVEWYDKDSSN